MLEYLEYKLKRMNPKGSAMDFGYPIYYEKNGRIIREEKDGRKFEVKLDKDHKEHIVRELSAK